MLKQPPWKSDFKSDGKRELMFCLSPSQTVKAKVGRVQLPFVEHYSWNASEKVRLSETACMINLFALPHCFQMKCFSCLQCARHTHLPGCKVSSALLPGFSGQQQVILSEGKMLSITVGLLLMSQRLQRGFPRGRSQLPAAAPAPSSWREECTWKRRKTVMKSINNCWEGKKLGKINFSRTKTIYTKPPSVLR